MKEARHSSQSTLIVPLWISPFCFWLVLCFLILSSCSAALLSYNRIETVILSSRSGPPRMTNIFLFYDLNILGQKPNWAYSSLLMGIIDHSQVYFEYIQGGADIFLILAIQFFWLSLSSSFLTPPNFKIYLFLKVVRECLELRLFREWIMYIWELQAGTNFSHLARQPSLSFQPPTIQISPPNSQTLKNLLSVSIDLTAKKLSSTGLLQSHLTICLDDLLPQPMIQQQLLGLQKTD